MKANIYKYFDGLTAFNSYLENNKVTKTFEKNQASHTGTLSFTGTKTFEEARSLMLYGDKGLAKKLNDSGLSAARSKIYKERQHRQLTSAVVGAVANVPAYVSGSPNSMITYRQNRVRQRVVNVAYNCAVFGGTDCDDIINSAVRLLIALMKIEAAGTQVNLYAVNLDSTGDGLNSFAIRIKTAGQKFDVLKMAFPIAHPSMNRRMKFRFTEVTDGVPDSYAFGYGCPQTNDKEIEKHFNSHGLKLDKAFCNESLNGMTTDNIIEAIMGKH